MTWQEFTALLVLATLYFGFDTSFTVESATRAAGQLMAGRP